MKMFEEFKKFAMRGNVVDLAVGIIVGAGFGKIVSSFVNDILMPPIGMALGGLNFGEFKITLAQAVVDAAGKIVKPAVTINYGNFFQTIIDFLIIAFSVFLVIKAMNSLSKKKEEAPAAPPEPSKEEVLLTEIRDILKNK